MSVTRKRIRVESFPTGIDMAIKDCGTCGVVYAVTDNYDGRRREDGRTFYCPNGHQRIYHETNLDKMRKDRDRLKATNRHLADQRDAAHEQADHQKRRAAAYQGKFRSQKQRIDNGVCPYCNRTFKDVRRHMHSQHPKAGETE